MNQYNMTDLQQELFDELKDDLVNTDPEDIAKSIKCMDAVELRRNIAVFTQTNEFIRECEIKESRDRMKQLKAGSLCRSGFRPCIHRRHSSDNTCEHYPNADYT